MNQITFKQYRNIDLTILVVLTIIFEAITTMATARWFVLQPIALSISLALICVTMMRWSGWAAITAVIGGMTFCIASGATAEQYLIYCIGNLFTLLALILVKVFGKEKIRTNTWRLLLFGLVGYIGMVLGRGIVSMFFGGDPMTLVVYATTDIMSLVFAEVILLLLRKLDGMIEDQKAYLFRLDRERKAEQETYMPEQD
ncbi:MAG: hypothetical protein IJY09_10085 [Lachnospiraceae bacterium]|nr:hypothetical protein [Lachnospiraceae bacterium]